MSPGIGTNEGRDSLSRRPFLLGIGAAGIAGVAGCVSAVDDIDPDTPAEQRIYDGFQEEDIEPPIDVTITVNRNNPDRVAWAQLLANDLDETDMFDVDIDEIEWGTYLDYVMGVADDPDENPLICLGAAAGWDPHSYVNTMFHSAYHTP